MRIRFGDRLPDAVFTVMGPSGPEIKSTAEIFAGRLVSLFALPGAYTPICHREHLPGIIALAGDLRRKGVDTIACTAVNDIYVLDRWALELGASGRVMMLADGNAEFAVRTGLAVDLARYGLGVRSARYAMLAENGTVKLLSVDEVLTTHDKSSAATLCSLLDRAA